jgi:hypothetical protein
LSPGVSVGSGSTLVLILTSLDIEDGSVLRVQQGFGERVGLTP